MPSSAVANLSLALGIRGESFDISSACASSTHAIMVAARLLASEDYDLAITGGTEELDWVNALGFNAMRALSRKYNATPERASRPFDRERDGFVISSGAGVLVMETENHAKRRGAKIISTLSGMASNSNATDMVVPDVASGMGVMRCAIESAGLSPTDISYVNTHGTSTPTGDPLELQAIRELFGERASDVWVNSTKSMTGHMIGATGAVEAIFCTIMQEHGFLSPSLNLDEVEPGFEWANIVRKTLSGVRLDHILSNSFGFGGTNACVILSSPQGN
jgi:3-oxoacyl-[acyl-carrier-protein] synthase-1